MTSMTYGRSKNRYLGDALATATPATLLVMLYDRLLLDLQRAEKAQREQDRETAHTNLIHAQAIVQELQSSLDLEAWEGAPGLMSLYTWLLQEMSNANVDCDPERTARCRVDTVEPLAEAWREAALKGMAGSTGSA
ncbi:flagellar export chaperone FliS [Kineococcus endophyticus]|uniref:Flagellar export chaperone FliS n=1 Tax=Kineococcus endophyticus TaxID=1181883 RepID=A0ABV3P7F5_9ACTN